MASLPGPARSPGRVDSPLWLAHRKRRVGDLDNILLRALDMRPEHHYASGDAPAVGVQAHLAGYPGSARPQGVAYLLVKFTRRNKALVVALALGLRGLAVGLGVSVWQGRQAAAARDLAQARRTQIRDITHDVVLRYGDAMTCLPAGLTVKEDCLKGLIGNLDRLASEMGDDPEGQAHLTAVYARLAELQGDASFVEAYLRALQIQAQTLRAAGKPIEVMAML